MVKKIYPYFILLTLMSFCLSCTEETPVIKEPLKIEIVDTVVNTDTVTITEHIKDTFKIFKLTARNNPRYIDDAFIISVNHDDLKNLNTGNRYRLTVRAFFASVVGESSWDNRTLIRFNDINFLNDKAQIDSCFLKLHVFFQNGCNSNDCRPLGENLLSIHPISNEWKEHEVTWTNQPAFETNTEIRTSKVITPSDTLLTLNITDIAKYWQENNNYGLLIKMTNENSLERIVEFYSSDYLNENLRPQLTLYYHED